jgi:general secretion pathway protein G
MVRRIVQAGIGPEADEERDLRAALREMREAIDKYHDYNLLGYFGPIKEGTNAYPESLEILVEGAELTNAEGGKMRFLRKIPRDPFTGQAEWGLRSDQDDPRSLSWGGENVFDVYSKTFERDSEGTPYAEW